MRIAIRKEKYYDVGFITFEELQEMLETMLEDGGCVSIGGVGYSLRPKDGHGMLLAEKKLFPEVAIELNTPTGKIKITKDDMLVVGIEGRPYVMNKERFEMSFEEIAEKGEIK